MKRTEEGSSYTNVAKKRSRSLHGVCIDLPDEILLKIFSFLPPIPYLVRIRPVCRTWNNTLSDPLLWLRVDFLSLAGNATDSVVSSLFDLCSSTKILNLGGCSSVTRCIMELIPSKCTALTHLNISQIQIPCISINAIINSLPQLLKVDLSFTKTNNATLANVSKSCPNLEYCSFRGCESVSKLPKFGPNLQYLDASGSLVPTCVIPYLITEKLEVLLMWGIAGTNSGSLQRKNKIGFPKLQKFHLSSEKFPPNSSEIAEVLWNSNQLVELRVNVKVLPTWIYRLTLGSLQLYSGFIGDDELEFLISNSSVKTLEIAWAPVTRTSLSKLYLLSDIEALDVCGSPIEEADLKSIATHCAKLTDFKLKIESCRNIPRNLRTNPLEKLRTGLCLNL